MQRLRSRLFSLAFPAWTGLCCIALAVSLLLPRQRILTVVVLWVRSVAWLERAVLGLDYQVLGTENLPRHGAFVVAAKHQSAFETMKMHLILNDPAIVMKRELLDIPIWGAFTRKAGMIPIDRGAGRRALSDMLRAARAAKAAGRPIVIFPQGTRVAPGLTRAYKPGVIALYRALDLPIVPLALDSGLFWPSKGPKRGGVVTFQFLPPIAPGLEPGAALAVLHDRLEAGTNRLIAPDRAPAPGARAVV